MTIHRDNIEIDKGLNIDKIETMERVFETE